MILTQEAIDLVEEKLRPLAEEGRKATFAFVPVGRLSPEAVLGLVGWLGREQVKQQQRMAQQLEMSADLLRVATRRGA
ncbi:MAG: hypothetical protein WC683_01020 [bacterium]